MDDKNMDELTIESESEASLIDKIKDTKVAGCLVGAMALGAGSMYGIHYYQGYVTAAAKANAAELAKIAKDQDGTYNLKKIGKDANLEATMTVTKVDNKISGNIK